VENAGKSLGEKFIKAKKYSTRIGHHTAEHLLLCDFPFSGVIIAAEKWNQSLGFQPNAAQMCWPLDANWLEIA